MASALTSLWLSRPPVDRTDNDLRDLAAVLLAYDADVITIISRDGLNEFHQYIDERREAA